jgi:hypothetical protein
MRITLVGLLAMAALFLVIGARSSGTVEATHPANPQPLLLCADVNGDTAVSVSDISRVVGRFGSNDPNWTANGTYHPLYDLNPSGTGAITVQDITTTVADFGLNCGMISPVDTEIARATLDIVDPSFHPPAPLPDFPGDAGLLTENPTLLASKGYFRASTDVAGQGVHYVHNTYYTDNLYWATTPEGLVYEGGRLRAQLYYVDGDAVGWGGTTPGTENVDIDDFCVPVAPNTTCSWTSGADGWHDHVNLCTVAIGHPSAAAIPGVSSAANCQNLHDGWCGGSKCGGTTWRWEARVGWMGHMWNHMLNHNPNPLDIAGNGRFTDCFPDSEHWNGFNCPQ